MDKKKLSDRLQQLLESGTRTDSEKIFIRLTQQVWQIDWTVAPFDIWTHMIEWDVPYFRRFMAMDEGDEQQEEALIIDWTRSRLKLDGEAKADRKKGIIQLIEELNRARSEVRRSN